MWENKTLFLQKDESEEKTLKLKDIYVVPNYEKWSYKWSTNNKSLEVVIDEFLNETNIKNNKPNPYIILGQAGMGKSSLVSYICSKYAKSNKLIVIRFSDLNEDIINSSQDGLWKAILKLFNCDKVDLEEKCLIVDGFDEAKINVNQENLLYHFLLETQNIKNLKVMITSRENYFNYDRFNKFHLLKLQYFDEEKIDEFVQKYSHKMKLKEKIEIKEINEVMGIPIILYMIVSLGIDVEKDTDICDLYDKVFSLESGIYTRLYADSLHPTEHNKEVIHKIAQKIAFAMFEKDGRLEKDEYENIVEDIMKKENQNLYNFKKDDFLIANYYDKGKTLYFVHKSIYEYFVAEYMYYYLLEVLEQKDDKTIACRIGELFKKRKLSFEIINYLKHKILSKEDFINEILYENLKEVFIKMLNTSMTYYMKDKYILKTEVLIFSNYLDLLRILKGNNKNYIIFNDNSNQLEVYIKLYLDIYEQNQISLAFIGMSNINLRGVNLSGVDLRGADLRKANLRGANLRKVDLRRTDLRGTNLRGADLRGTNLRGVNLRGVNLRGADLREADLRETNLIRADLKGTDLRGADLREAHLEEANLIEADLREVNLRCVYLSKTKFDKDNIKELENQNNKMMNKVIVYIKKYSKEISYLSYKSIEAQI